MNDLLNPVRDQSLNQPISFLHTHSTMTRLLEEIEAHAAAIIMDSDSRGAVIADLAHYLQLFKEDVFEHIEEEETQLFPAIKKYLGAHYAIPMDRLYVQHETIKRIIRDADEIVSKLQTDNDNSALAQSLNDSIRWLKEAFIMHSNHERVVLQQAQEAQTLIE